MLCLFFVVVYRLGGFPSARASVHSKVTMTLRPFFAILISSVKQREGLTQAKWDNKGEKRMRGVGILIGIGCLMTSCAAHGRFCGGESALEAFAVGLAPGDIVLVGETHGTPEHIENLLALTDSLALRGVPFSVGLEFLDWKDQVKVDDYLAGRMSEADFVEGVWDAGYAFDLYKRALRAPIDLDSKGGWAYALNASREAVRSVRLLGLDKMPPHLRSELPLDFTLGSESYKRHFQSFLPHLKDNPEELESFFRAQSAWDETMAWQTSLTRRPKEVYLVLAGVFHVEYGLGLPSRVRARVDDEARVKIFSQYQGETPDLCEVHSEFGVRRGDLVFESKAETR